MKDIRPRRSGYVFPVFLILAGCAVSEPDLVPKDVMTLPDISYEPYRKVVVYVDMADLPESQRAPALVWETEAGLRNRGFDVLGHNDYVGFLKTRGFLPSRTDEAGRLRAVQDELGRSAVVRVRVAGFSALARTERRDKIVTPGVPGVREAPMTFLEDGLHDWRKWVVDLSLTFDMIDTATASVIWSCSMACSQFPYEGKLQTFFRKVVGRCFDTLPLR